MRIWVNDMSALFGPETTNEYLEGYKNDLLLEIASISDEKIMRSDFEGWIDYFFDKYAISTIVLHEEHLSRVMIETQEEKSNPFYNQLPFTQQYYSVDVYKITYKIPFEGDEKLLNLHPYTYVKFIDFNDASFERTKKDECAILSVDLSLEKKEFDGKEDFPSFVSEKFEHLFVPYRDMIRCLNSDFKRFNYTLRDLISKNLKIRKEKASAFFKLGAALNIPLYLNENTPNTVPIPLKRIVRRPPNEPALPNICPEYCISEFDYNNISNIIDMYCRATEMTPVVYFGLDEESIRDIILATLNTHYDATGESFRKNGKTDILVQFDNKAAYIAEIKIWHGEKCLNDAINQLSGYSTWRDTKLSLVFFNKQNKNFLALAKSLESSLRKCMAQVIPSEPNIWDCLICKPGTNETIKIHVALYDINYNSSK